MPLKFISKKPPTADSKKEVKSPPEQLKTQSPTHSPPTQDKEPTEAPIDSIAEAVAKSEGDPPLPEQGNSKQPKQSLFEALDEYLNSTKKKTLMVVKKENGAMWKVLGYEKDTKRVVLQDSAGVKIRPILRDRENELYYPQWR